MPTVDYYTDNVYTEEYYLAQYIMTSVLIRKKYCCMLLTENERNMLKERMPELTINYLRSIPDSNYSVYSIYSD